MLVVLLICYKNQILNFASCSQNQFLKRLLILFVHLFCLSISVYLRSESDDEDDDSADLFLANVKSNSTEPNGDSDTNIRNMIRYCSEVATLVCVLSYVIFQQGDEIKNQGLSAFAKQMVVSE